MNSVPTDDELIRDVCKVTAKHKWNENIQYTGYCGATTLATTVFGGLVFGPIGILIGGVLGSTGSYLAVRGKFSSGVEILMNLTEEEKHILGNRIRNLLNMRNVASVLLLVESRDGATMIMSLVRAFLAEARGVQFS